MSFPERDAYAIDYILQNRATYSRAQLDEVLLGVGYEQSALDSYWAGIAEGEADAGREHEANERRRDEQVRTEERELRSLTKNWTAPIVVRTYESNRKGEEAFAAEVAILARHQYEPATQSAEGSHLHAGRLLLTGGLSVFAGRRGIRSKGKLTVTFRRVQQAVTSVPAQEAADPIAQIRKLADLRDAGVLTEDEFAAKKAELLSRM